MRECAIPTPHPPHCPKCGGPVDIWVYEDVHPGHVVTAGMCQAECVDVVPCDGGLTSSLGEWEILNEKDTRNLARKVVETSQARWDVCLHQPGCANPPIDAHTVPYNWMKAIDSSQVYLFRPSPRPLGPPEEPLAVPHKVSIRRATTAKFACDEHDKVFETADRREGTVTSERRLNLLFYRALLKALHHAMAAGEVAETHVGALIEGMSPEVGGINGQRISALKLASGLLRTSLTYPILKWRIRHVTKHLPGTPRMACSAAGDWVHYWTDSWNGPAIPVEAEGAWGLTIMPRHDGHLVTLHWCTVAENRGIAERHLVKMGNEMQVFNGLEGAELEEALSCYAIFLAEDLCMGTQSWEAYTAKRKTSIREAWLSNNRIPNESFGEMVTGSASKGELREINLFR